MGCCFPRRYGGGGFRRGGFGGPVYRGPGYIRPGGPVIVPVVRPYYGGARGCHYRR